MIEAVKPYEWQPRAEWENERFPPTAYPSKKIMETVERRWNEIGISLKKVRST
jgi:hypothetical protein